jgi:hypothetical protein
MLNRSRGDFRVWCGPGTQLVDQLVEEHRDAVVDLGAGGRWRRTCRHLLSAPLDDLVAVGSHKFMQHEAPKSLARRPADGMWPRSRTLCNTAQCRCPGRPRGPERVALDESGGRSWATIGRRRIRLHARGGGRSITPARRFTHNGADIAGGTGQPGFAPRPSTIGILPATQLPVTSGRPSKHP